MAATLSCLSPKAFTDPTWPLESPWRKSSAVSRTEASIASTTVACTSACLDTIQLLQGLAALFDDLGRAYQNGVFGAEPLVIGTEHCRVSDEGI